jgi:hypothetical protein
MKHILQNDSSNDLADLGVISRAKQNELQENGYKYIGSLIAGFQSFAFDNILKSEKIRDESVERIGHLGRYYYLMRVRGKRRINKYKQKLLECCRVPKPED